ncbi:MAG: hypothetical protein AB1725_01855 [Armatimonadota bacterium]
MSTVHMVNMLSPLRGNGQRLSATVLWAALVFWGCCVVSCTRGSEPGRDDEGGSNAGTEEFGQRVDQAKVLISQIRESGKLDHAAVDFIVDALAHPDPLQSRAALPTLVAMVETSPELGQIAISLAVAQAIRARDAGERAFWVGASESLLSHQSLLRGEVLGGKEAWRYEQELRARDGGPGEQ